MPLVHWGNIGLRNYERDEQIVRTFAAAGKAGNQLITPKLSEMVGPTNHKNTDWRDGTD